MPDLTFTATSSAEDYRRMLKVGLSPRQAEFLTTVTDWTDVDERRKYRHAFSKRQWQVITEGPITMAGLLKGGFTRHQATLIVAANA